MSLSLRPYQHEALDAIADAVRQGTQRPLVALPTGAGKTVVFAHLLHARGGRALVLAHRDELLGQAADKLAMVDPGVPVGLVRAERDEHWARIVVGSVQTLAQPKRLTRLTTDFRTVVVDEAHHAAAASYRRILEHVGAFDPSGPLAVGFTATPERGDGAGLDSVWQAIVYQKTILDLVQAGYLVDLRGVQVRLQGADWSKLRVTRGDFSERELESALLDADAPEHAVAAYQQHASGRKALVFTPTVRVAEAMAGAFRDAGIAAEALSGDTGRDARRALLRRLASGETRVVCNCAVLTEGFDEPSVDCVVIARPTRSRPLYVQMIGRGTRLYPGKTDCLIVDLVGASTRHDLVTAARLFGLPPDTLATEGVRRAVAEKGLGSAEPKPAMAGTLVAQAVDPFAGRPLRWVTAGDGHVLDLGDGWLRLEREPDPSRWRVVRQHADRRRETLVDGLDLGYAQGWAEDHAREAGATRLLDPAAAWRQRPASEKQRTLLARYGVVIANHTTAGEASELITRTLAGSRRRR